MCFRVIVAVIKHHDQRQLVEERVLFTKQLVVEVNQGENLSIGTDEVAMEECYLVLASNVMFRLFSCSIQDHQPKGATTHIELGLLLSIISQEDVPKACPQTNLLGPFSQLCFSLLKGL